MASRRASSGLRTALNAGQPFEAATGPAAFASARAFALSFALWRALHHPFQLAYCAMVGAMMGYTFTASGAALLVIDGLANNDRLRINYVLLTLAGLPHGVLKMSADIAGLVGLYNYNGPAILNAVRAAGKAGKVKIVCFDENDETLEGVASGDIYGTVVQQPFEFGKQAITKMAKHLAGDKEALAGGKQIVPTKSLKKADVAEFQANLKKTLGK